MLPLTGTKKNEIVFDRVEQTLTFTCEPTALIAKVLFLSLLMPLLLEQELFQINLIVRIKCDLFQKYLVKLLNVNNKTDVLYRDLTAIAVFVI